MLSEPSSLGGGYGSRTRWPWSYHHRLLSIDQIRRPQGYVAEKCNKYGEVVRAKPRLVAKISVRRKDGNTCISKRLHPRLPPVSVRFVAAMVVKRDMDLFHLDAEQAFVQTKLDTKNHLKYRMDLENCLKESPY